MLNAVFLLAACITQTPDVQAQVLTLAQARSLAQSANVDLAIARERVAKAHVLASQAWTVLAPVVTASGAGVRNNTAAKFAAGLPLELKPVFDSLGVPFPRPQIITVQELYQVQASANLNWPLVNGRAIPLIKNAKASAQLADVNYEQTEATLLYAASLAYFNVIAAERQVDIEQRALASSKEHLRVAKARRDVGEATELEVLRAEVEVATDEQRLIQVSNAAQISKRSLAVLIGWLDENGQVREFSVERPELAAPDEEEDLLSLAYQRRLDLKARHLELGIAHRSKTDSWLKFLPTLAGTGNVRWTNATGFTGQKTSWQLGIALQWTLFEGGRTLFELQERQHDINVSMLAINKTRQDIAKQVGEARLNLKSAEASLEVASRRVQLAERTVSLVEVQYEAGVATQLEVLDAQRAFANAETAQALAELSDDIALLTLQQTLIAPTEATGAGGAQGAGAQVMGAEAAAAPAATPQGAAAASAMGEGQGGF